MATLACPHCYTVTRLGTLEQVSAVSFASAFTRADDGQVHVEHEGESEVFWETSETVGVHCRDCGFESEGDDWADDLLVVPAFNARVAGALALFDADPDASADESDLIEAACAVEPATLADPRVQLLTTLVENELTPAVDGWNVQLTDIFDVVAEYAPRVVDGVLAEPDVA